MAERSSPAALHKGRFGRVPRAHNRWESAAIHSPCNELPYFTGNSGMAWRPINSLSAKEWFIYRLPGPSDHHRLKPLSSHRGSHCVRYVPQQMGFPVLLLLRVTIYPVIGLQNFESYRLQEPSFNL